MGCERQEVSKSLNRITGSFNFSNALAQAFRWLVVLLIKIWKTKRSTGLKRKNGGASIRFCGAPFK